MSISPQDNEGALANLAFLWVLPVVPGRLVKGILRPFSNKDEVWGAIREKSDGLFSQTGIYRVPPFRKREV